MTSQTAHPTDSPQKAELATMPATAVVILAAGQGKRMHASVPKVLHRLAGRSMLGRVIDSAKALRATSITVIYGHGGDIVRAEFADDAALTWALQSPQLGTGHAVQQALPYVSQSEVTLVLYGDVPLIKPDTLARLVYTASENTLAWLTQNVSDPTGLGRIVRDDQERVVAIVEDKDATAPQKTINEINTGFLACPTAWLKRWLPQLRNDNAQTEYYLTDILAMAVAEGCQVTTLQPTSEWEVAGVNTKSQLAALERIHQREQAERLMQDGVSLLDPDRFDLRGVINHGQDVEIDANVILEGTVTLGNRVQIGANCILRNAIIGDDSLILPFSHIEDAAIGARARIGPYARLRPATTLADDVHIGNFVEVKASQIGQGSKANHLSYVGDSTVGRAVNIGAGTITCNYDGANKHRTVIEDNVHIGSDVQLIAPVRVGKDADIAAGTTVWKDVPPGGLTLNEKNQITKPQWQRPVKRKT